MTRAWALAAVALVACALIDVSPRRARAQVADATRFGFPIRVHLVHDAPGHWYASLQWAREQVEAANAAFEPAGIHFAINDDWLPDPATGPAWAREAGSLGHPTPTGWLVSARTLRATTRDDHVGIDVFVVAGIHDATGCSFGLALEPDPPGGARFGPPRGPGLIAIVPATAPVLAHELGHFLALDHSADPQNLMFDSFTPGDRGEELSLDEAQRMTARARAAEMLRARTVHGLIEVPPPHRVRPVQDAPTLPGREVDVDEAARGA